MRAYRFLDADDRAPFTGVQSNPGVWVEARAAEPCREGAFHFALETQWSWRLIGRPQLASP